MSKVMVIDDEPFILMMVEDKLKKAGFEVVKLRESVGALDKIRQEKPDLIILDWMMPELSGIELCKMIKAEAKLREIPIFMLTAKGQEDEEKQGLMSGVDKYITKPFSPKALLEYVMEKIGKSQP